MAQRNSTHNDLQNIALDRATQNPLKTGGELMCSGKLSSSCSTCRTHHVILVTNTVISHE